jgi:hypothetical protein
MDIFASVFRFPSLMRAARSRMSAVPADAEMDEILKAPVDVA